MFYSEKLNVYFFLKGARQSLKLLWDITALLANVFHVSLKQTLDN